MRFEKVIEMLRMFHYEKEGKQKTITFLKFIIEMLEKGGKND